MQQIHICLIFLVRIMCDSKADILKLPLSNDTDLIDQYKNAYRMLVESHDELGLCAIDLLLQQENTVMPKENASQPSAAASDMALVWVQFVEHVRVYFDNF